jgi:hypothetical protein
MLPQTASQRKKKKSFLKIAKVFGSDIHGFAVRPTSKDSLRLNKHFHPSLMFARE